MQALEGTEKVLLNILNDKLKKVQKEILFNDFDIKIIKAKNNVLLEVQTELEAMIKEIDSAKE